MFNENEYEVIQNAIDLANECHKGTKRKSCPIPYFTHVMEVYKLLFNYGCQDPKILAAAILHDSIEDTTVTYEKLEMDFGIEIADYVMECSRMGDDSGTLEGKNRFMLSFKDKSYGSVMIKIADRVANTMDYYRSGNHSYAAWYALQAYPLLVIAYAAVSKDYGLRGIFIGTDILQDIITRKYGFSKNDMVEKEYDIITILKYPK